MPAGDDDFEDLYESDDEDVAGLPFYDRPAPVRQLFEASGWFDEDDLLLDMFGGRATPPPPAPAAACGLRNLDRTPSRQPPRAPSTGW